MLIEGSAGGGGTRGRSLSAEGSGLSETDGVWMGLCSNGEAVVVGCPRLKLESE